jgi:hypothetical protein
MIVDYYETTRYRSEFHCLLRHITNFRLALILLVFSSTSSCSASSLNSSEHMSQLSNCQKVLEYMKKKRVWNSGFEGSTDFCVSRKIRSVAVSKSRAEAPQKYSRIFLCCSKVRGVVVSAIADPLGAKRD